MEKKAITRWLLAMVAGCLTIIFNLSVASAQETVGVSAAQTRGRCLTSCNLDAIVTTKDGAKRVLGYGDATTCSGQNGIIFRIDPDIDSSKPAKLTLYCRVPGGDNSGSFSAGDFSGPNPSAAQQLEGWKPGATFTANIGQPVSVSRKGHETVSVMWNVVPQPETKEAADKAWQGQKEVDESQDKSIKESTELSEKAAKDAAQLTRFDLPFTGMVGTSWVKYQFGVRPGMRYYPDESGRGFFIGGHAALALGKREIRQFNTVNLLPGNEQTYGDYYLMGAGLNLGFLWEFGLQLRLDADVGMIHDVVESSLLGQNPNTDEVAQGRLSTWNFFVNPEISVGYKIPQTPLVVGGAFGLLIPFDAPLGFDSPQNNDPDSIAVRNGARVMPMVGGTVGFAF